MSGSLYTEALPHYVPRSTSARRFLAAVLRSASVALARLARSIAALERGRRGAPAEQVLEFYSEAGAPEGALYLDGKLIGYLPGVKRL
jgi:hypothetical protein